MKKRFLRDGVINEMLDDICSITAKVPDSNTSVVCSQSFASLVELYETNKIVLQYLEDVIDELREGYPVDRVIEKVVQAAAHIQIGCLSAHNTLQELFNDQGVIHSE